MATMVWFRPLARLSRWRTRAGRRFAVRRSELGNKTSTTSPRWVFIVDGGFRAVPVLSERLESSTQVGSLALSDAAFCEVHNAVSGGLFLEADAFVLLGKFAQPLQYEPPFGF